MTDKDIAEALCIFNKLEKIMRSNGAKGDSFSDLVKSYNPHEKNILTRTCREFTNRARNYFVYKKRYDYYELRKDILDTMHLIKPAHSLEELIEMSLPNGVNNEYENMIKESIIESYNERENLDEEAINNFRENVIDPLVNIYNEIFVDKLDSNIDSLKFIEGKYQDCKNHLKEYYVLRDGLLDGFYNELKAIGHERNQLLHVYNYKIDDFSYFKKVCYQTIRYLENGKIPLIGRKSLSLRKTKNITRSSSIDPKTLIISIVAIVFSVSSILYYESKREKPTNTQHEFSKKSKKEYYNYKRKISKETQTEIVNKEVYKKIDPKLCKDYFVSTRILNIRKKPEIKSNIISKVRLNDKLTICNTSNGWGYIPDKGWVSMNFLSTTVSKNSIKNISTSKKIIKKNIPEIWHCTAKSKRASGWAEKLGRKNAVSEALRQCEIRRVTAVPCKITNCFRIQ